MAKPPSKLGGVKLTTACAGPRTAATRVGALGTSATTNRCVTALAAKLAASPGWLAVIEQMPVVRKFKVLPISEHTAGVSTLKMTAKFELAVALIVGVLPIFCAPGLLKVMDCGAFATVADTTTEGLLGPAALTALSLKS